MIRVLLDTNVVLDVLLRREPWRVEAEAIWQAHFSGQIAAHVTASSVIDIFYVARRLAGRDRAWDAVIGLLDQFSVIAVGASELRSAVAGGGDFEDCLQAACAAAADMDFIVARDLAGFQECATPVLEPSAFLARLSSNA